MSTVAAECHVLDALVVVGEEILLDLTLVVCTLVVRDEILHSRLPNAEKNRNLATSGALPA
jgi:hypothetical protein